MFDIHNLYLFFITSLLLNITPGNDVMYVASRSTSQGSRAGYLSALGIFIGCFVHIMAAILGLSVIIAQSAFLFETIKYIGAGYLIFIGLKMILTRPVQPGKVLELTPQNNMRLLGQGILTNVLNPKVALFFLSFLPQFVDAHSPYLKFQLFTLGLWFDLQGTMVLMIVAFLIGRATSFMKRNPSCWVWQERVTGTILVTLGLKLAVSSKN